MQTDSSPPHLVGDVNTAFVTSLFEKQKLLRLDGNFGISHDQARQRPADCVLPWGRGGMQASSLDVSHTSCSPKEAKQAPAFPFQSFGGGQTQAG